jgi:ribosome-binding factor A
MKHRPVRVGEMIQREMSDLLRRKVKDPRLSMVMMTGVDMSPDLKLAKIYVRSLDQTIKKEALMEGLQSARGFLRRELGRCLELRSVPEVLFIYDTSQDYADHIESLLKSLEETET